MSHRLELRLAPLAVALILFSTAIPVDLRSPDWTLEPFQRWDFLANVLLYAPLGWLLGRKPLHVAALIAFVLSTTAEFSQGWFFERHVSAFDTLANVGGCVLGSMLARDPRVRKVTTGGLLPVGRSVTAAVTLMAITLVMLLAFPVKRSDLSNWDPGFAMLLGNEQTGDRPWRGEILLIALLPSPLSGSDARKLSLDSRAEAIDELTALDAYVLKGQVKLDGREGIQVPWDVSQRFAREAISEGTFSIVAWIATADIEQDGPARVISFSKDPFVRNFDLGQEGSRLVFRVRTPSIGENGNLPRAESADTLQPDQPVRIVATYNGAVARLYLDGQLHARNNLAALGCAVPAACDAAAPLLRGALGGSVALLALVLARPRRPGHRLTMALSAGASTAFLLHLTSHWMYIAPVISPWFGAMLVLAGSIIMAFAVRDPTAASAVTGI